MLQVDCVLVEVPSEVAQDSLVETVVSALGDAVESAIEVADQTLVEGILAQRLRRCSSLALVYVGAPSATFVVEASASAL